MTDKRVGMEVSHRWCRGGETGPGGGHCGLSHHSSDPHRGTPLRAGCQRELDAEFVPVESEHSALSVCAGTSAVGARTYTSTSAQGLELMHEILFVVAGMRLPIVMSVANRALSAPLSIWNDHSDIMAARDCGWVQIFTENGQEVFDQTICAFKIAEDRRVLIPAIVNLDGFTLSHVVESLYEVSQEMVDQFLPPYQPVHRL